MLEAENNPTPAYIREPSALARWIISKRVLGPHMNGRLIEKRRRKAEKLRRRNQAPHRVDYYHQLDDPYSHLTAQILARFAERYNIELSVYLIRASGGGYQPEFEKLAHLARRDAEIVAPYLGLSFPRDAGTVPLPVHQVLAGKALATEDTGLAISRLVNVSTALWSGDETTLARLAQDGVSKAALSSRLDAGSTRLSEYGHYSGATFFYGGEWYWGVDRLFHLERRLRALGACKQPELELLVPRPDIDVIGVDASQLRLDYYPSLNSPYTAIGFDHTIALKNECGIEFHHKPVLPMIMRGVPSPRNKSNYIVFDTKREADALGVPFGNVIFPIGMPTRNAYSLLPWAMSQGRDEALMSALLRHAFAMGVGLHKQRGMRRAVEAAGLNWDEAAKVIGTDDWKPMVERHQAEMVEGLGLWGVPSYRLSGPNGEPDLAVWGQDRLWLIAAEIRRRACLQE
ncbi:MAG: DsbA family protein [Pseudomonadota bacterium]